MPILFQYLLKLSISLAIMYIFYQLVLRRLTFYNHNRWYLFGYSVLCFLISLINIGPILEKNDVAEHEFVNLIPSLEHLTNGSPAALPAAEDGMNSGAWEWLVLLLFVGAGLLLARLVVQLVSFKRLKAGAQLITGEKIKFYQVNRNIIPFSFGNAIYINQYQHTEAELKEIIRHEFVHVKQGHTADIIWSEILCIINWYNPFAWLIRRTIRQNLEFIADHKVIANGVDKKQYQLLLLKVIGNSHFSIAAPFNFSSLKKRIVMMNKIKSARVHLLKFLFILPLLAILLLAFRDKLGKPVEDGNYYFTGLTLDAKNGKPLKGVVIREAITGAQSISDENGYFKLSIAQGDLKFKPSYSFQREGYTAVPIVKNIDLGIVKNKVQPNVEYIYLARINDGENAFSYLEYYPGEPDYDIVVKKFEAFRKKNDLPNDRGSDTIPDKISKPKPPVPVSPVAPTAPALPASPPSPPAQVSPAPPASPAAPVYIGSPGEGAGKGSGVGSGQGSGKGAGAGSGQGSGKGVGIGFGFGITSKPLIFVDGEPWPAHLDINIINGEKIESMSVYKGESAISIYGDKAKDGVISIVTKQRVNIKTEINVSEPVYFLNGKKITKQAADLIDPVQIKSIDVLKGKNAIEKYGDDGKNGVIEITTSVAATTINRPAKASLPGWDLKNYYPAKKKDEC